MEQKQFICLQSASYKNSCQRGQVLKLYFINYKFMGVQAMCTIIQNSTNFEVNYVLINDEFFWKNQLELLKILRISHLLKVVVGYVMR